MPRNSAASTERRVRCPGEEGKYALREIVQQQRRAGDESGAHGRRAGGVAALTKAGSKLGFLRQKLAQQPRRRHAQRCQCRKRPAAGQRRQIPAVKMQGLGQQIGQRCCEHDPARKARRGGQKLFRWFAKHRQHPAQTCRQTGEGGKDQW